MTYKTDLFEKMPIVGILRGFQLTQIEEIIPYYIKAGFTTLEVTMNSPEVHKIISALSYRNSDLNIGAGTVCTMDELKLALDAGASFIVSPIINEQVIGFCVSQNIPIFPGAFTPSEIYKASQLGATAVKIFPATALGPQYVKDILAPLNTLKLLPTGGVSIDNIKAYFKAGAYGVGMGGSLFDGNLIAEKDYEGLYKHFLAIKNLVFTST
jgi:2-dehydro-3-deoxyphosphogluconate aldolase/(4S)-4-hydroxy-2-oxoglutarate aldolase